MDINEKLNRINNVISVYFNTPVNRSPVPAKDLMPLFIKAGIFSKDHKNGLPIRQLLRQLDERKQLHLVPFVHAVRNQANTNWFFAPAKYQPTTAVMPVKPIADKNPERDIRRNSDEAYVLDLCDEILQLKCIRQHTFPFLQGDAGATGKRALLPVDGWYKELNLVVEYHEKQHTEPVAHFDKRITVSGVNRGEQRKIYDRRKKEVLNEAGIKLLIISYTDLKHGANKRLTREREFDRTVMKEKLKGFMM